MLDIEVLVNGRAHTLSVRPTDVLLDVLRDTLDLTSVREGCGIGMCGACTVLLDGQVVSSCLMLAAKADARSVTTLEGLSAADGELSQVQQAFLDKTAFQCSYCTPGFILTTQALLDDISDPDPEEIKEYLAGNLCRCGSYVKILEAVASAAQSRGEQPPAQ